MFYLGTTSTHWFVYKRVWGFKMVLLKYFNYSVNCEKWLTKYRDVMFLCTNSIILIMTIFVFPVARTWWQSNWPIHTASLHLSCFIWIHLHSINSASKWIVWKILLANSQFLEWRFSLNHMDAIQYSPFADKEVNWMLTPLSNENFEMLFSLER